MKVFLKPRPSISQQLDAAARAAEEQSREVDHFEVTQSEMDSLRFEVWGLVARSIHTETLYRGIPVRVVA